MGNLHSTLRGTVYPVESDLDKMKTILIALGLLLCVAYAEADDCRDLYPGKEYCKNVLKRGWCEDSWKMCQKTCGKCEAASDKVQSDAFARESECKDAQNEYFCW